MKKTQRENIFNQASFTKAVWELANDVMNNFEQGLLKGSKTSKEAPEFKQYHLAPLHHLPEAFLVSMYNVLVTIDEFSIMYVYKIHILTDFT